MTLRTLPLDELRRRRTLKWSLGDDTTIPMWVAESDFDTCPAVMDALRDCLERQVLGYPSESAELQAATRAWMHDQFGWGIQHVFSVPDVVKGLGIAIRYFTPADSPVVLLVPSYPSFFPLLDGCGRKGIFISVRGWGNCGDGRAAAVSAQTEAGGALGESGVAAAQGQMDAGEDSSILDFDAIEAAFAAGARSIVLANPYNPTGYCFQPEELRRLCDLADRYGARVLSDEIHAPVVYSSGSHTPTASVSETAAKVTITVTATSKGWNTAGLKCAQIIFTNPEDVATFHSVPELDSHGMSPLGQRAATAAMTDGREWLREEVEYLEGNRDFLVDALAKRRGPRVHRPDATYLLWADFSEVQIPGTETTFGASGISAGAWIREHTGVIFSEGGTFVPAPELVWDGLRAGKTLAGAVPSAADATDAAGSAEFARSRGWFWPEPDAPAATSGWVRINYATSREIIELALARVDEALGWA